MENKLYLYNTSTKEKELFRTENSEVGFYCCGPTVYNFAHIGNLKTYIFEDVLKRVLISCGYKVKHIVNITDVGHLTSDADAEDYDASDSKIKEKILDNFNEAILDDLNMPRALAAVWDILHSKEYSADEKKQAITYADRILGLDLLNPEPEKIEILLNSEEVKNLKIRIISDAPCPKDLQNTIHTLIVERKIAREEKNYEKADKLREQLQNMGVSIKDLSDGTTECSIKK